jgi:glycosyltransferase involved in cell wall biosynthesis
MQPEKETTMKVAIVHYWLVSMRGGEKVVEQLCEMYPQADIFTLVCDPEALSPSIRRHKIITSFIQRIPGAIKNYKRLLPLMPFALEQFDLSEYDLVLSSESGPAKGIIPRPGTMHICYCHTPMRYIWDHYHHYRSESGFLSRAIMPLISPMIRQWDVTTSLRVDAFVANSAHVASRIKRFYNREAVVIHPPVAVDDFAISAEIGDFYLCAGQLVGYKRIDLAIRAFNELAKPLVVLGEGEQLAALKKIAGPTISFVGRRPFAELKRYLATCRALVFPGEEDFGIVPVEAMASGRPVIAFNRGGVRETVVAGRTGLFFDEQSTDSLVRTIKDFERNEAGFDPIAIRDHAKRFADAVFRSRMQGFVNEALLGNQRRDTTVLIETIDTPVLHEVPSLATA